VASVSTDLTEFKQAEKAVRESEEKFSKIFHSSPVGMVMSHLPDGRCVDVNEAYLKMLEYRREEMLGRDSRDLNMHINPDKRDEVFRLLREQGKVNNIELNFRTKTGRVVEILSSIDTINLQGQDYSLSTNIDITARKRAEAEVVHLASFPELNPNPVLEVEPDGTVTYANPSARSHFSLMTQGCKRQFLKDFINSLQTAGTQSFTKDVKIEDSWYEETLAFESSTKNYMLYARDITKRKKAEMALQESEARLEFAMETSHTGAWDLDLVNQTAIRSSEHDHIFGYNELLPQWTYEMFLDHVFPEDRQLVDAAFHHAIETHGNWNFECRIRRKDGVVRWILAAGRQRPATSGTLSVMAGIVQDITERKEAEIALKASEEKYRNLFENMVEEVHFWKLVRDDSGGIKTWRLVDVNPPALRTWGRQTVDEIRGKTTDEIFGLGSTEHFMPIVQKIMTEGIPYSYEDYFPNLNKYFRFTSVPIGEYFITTGSDITEIKQNEASLSRYAHELEASNKELEAFSYSVSHDLRAPLRSITGFSTILLEDYKDELDNEGKSYLKKISDSGELMGQLMDDLLKLSRVTRSDLNFERINLSDMAHKIVDELRNDDPKRKVKVTIAPNMHANGDKNLLGLVLQNLLGNAWKYSSKTSEPRIEMGTLEHNGKRAYFVRDNGVGFDMTYADKLFKPFQRLHKATEFTGTGIGLATVQRIIRRHGGEVWAESKVGEGATFYFTLS
jgi:PAS domain S-box-containing protein